MSRKRLVGLSERETPEDAPRPIVIVGAGNMGGAIARGLSAKENPLILIDPGPVAGSVSSLKKERITLATNPSVLTGSSPIAIIFAVKPQLLSAIAPLYVEYAQQALVISVAAGTTTTSLSAWLNNPPALIRAMPNLPAAIGKGITAGYATPGTSADQKLLCEGMLRSIGDFVWVTSEQQIDVVTAVSGSGPAYVFHLVECLASAAQKQGLPLAIAQQLARKTVEGAGALLTDRNDTPTDLRQSVTSKGGTTEAAMNVLMAGAKMENLLIEAVDAATKRAAELAKS